MTAEANNSLLESSNPVLDLGSDQDRASPVLQGSEIAP